MSAFLQSTNTVRLLEEKLSKFVVRLITSNHCASCRQMDLLSCSQRVNLDVSFLSLFYKSYYLCYLLWWNEDEYIKFCPLFVSLSVC